MEALAAQVTADFAAASRREPSNDQQEPNGGNQNRRRQRRNRPKPSQNRQVQQELGPQASTSDAGPSNKPRQRQRRQRNGAGTGTGTDSDARHIASSTASSDNEHARGATVQLPAPVTQVTDPSQRIVNQNRSRYRSQLSEPAVRSSPSARFAPPTAAELEKLTYRERLTAQLNTSSIDCPICINNIHRRQPIASCQTCSAPYHLKCLRDWAERSIASVKEKAAMLQNQPGVQIRANWRCPSCQTQYHEDAKPKAYWCFCGRIKDPQGSSLGNAHSCEQSCRKPRPEGCSHPCPLLCHPGICDACNVMLRMACHCGKEEKTIKCGTLHPQTAAEARINVDEFLSCGSSCGRLLPCGLHRCEKPCHPGECGDCEIIRNKQCYCGSNSITASCGGQDTQLLRHECTSAENNKRWTGEYSCGKPCLWLYDCGVHSEAQLSSAVCHPHTSEQFLQCPRSPQIVTKCPCGKQELELLSTKTRESCAEPIPTCGGICNKVRDTCGHPCAAQCHEGSCKPCDEQVTVVCRCGNDKKTVKCADTQQEELQDFRCERICKALRACGRHQCTRKCCPLAYQEATRKQRRKPLQIDDEDPLGLHICDRICGRKLNCGQHNCDQPDHRGPCRPCLRSSFDEISCHCGATVLMPPVPCSTRIRCNQPCAREGPPCGHPKPPHACHEDDVQCPPCPFLTERMCMCGSSSIKNVRCSQATVSCGRPCGKLLSCGYHRCRKTCHSPGDCEDCNQTCGKPKAMCGHPCQKACHAPSKCPIDDPCAELVEATCPCGSIKQRTRCGASKSQPISNAEQKLACTPACATAQRNAALAEALGISKDRPAGASQSTTWSQELLQFYGENMVWAKGMEQTFNELISSTRGTHLFSPMKYPQREFLHNVAQKYKLRSESLDEEPFRSVMIAKKAESAAPRPLLSEAWISAFKQPTAAQPAATSRKALVTPASKPSTPAPAPASRPEVNCLFLEACFGYDAETLEDLIRPSMQGLPFRLQWINDEDVLCIPDAFNVPSGDLALKMRLLRTAIRGRITNCKTVDPAVYDANQGVVTYREQSWTAVSGVPSRQESSNAAAAISAAAANGQASGGTSVNAFSKLSLGDARVQSRPASPVKKPQLQDGVMANGLHRPPSAVIVGTQQQKEEDVADNWEDNA